MHRNKFRIALLAGISLTLAACASKKEEVAAVQAPPTSARPEAPAAAAPVAPVASTGIPAGSQEDLRNKAGTDTVLFAYDSYELDGEARAVLARHAEWLKANPSVRVTLEGHCDERGTREYNLALGERRANSAKNFLAAQGVAVDRLSTISYGKERPAVAGTDEASFAQNRRAVTMVMGR
ncbi:peptidoglycan-associated lipoprotein Pal [Sandarakinorhabdus rubra]|uniref:peptidoglycan-associated lipoprotein Pal n=1 Tax=Sandarakinorhabdus rubra TaxID=2672568 RepID=UPI0013DB7DA0|nr:peptidoglycan-associated lipoprotein Pal [Sandarakinorhabdus rubra]